MKKLIPILFVSAIFTLQLMTACQMAPYQGQARDVRRRPQEGGVVAVDRNYRPEDRAKAETTMREVCAPRNFKIVEEGEVTTGQETTSDLHEVNRDNTQRKAGTLFGLPVTTGENAGRDSRTASVSRDLKEWQITYVCEKTASEKKAMR